MPSSVVMGVLGFWNKRKKLADDVFVTVKLKVLPTVTGAAPVNVTQFGSARLLVLCNT